MSLFYPTMAFNKITEISLETLNSLKIDCIILDVDNTIATHGGQEPIEGAIEWVNKVKDSGIKLVLVSNNFKPRLHPISKKFGLPFVSFSMKPTPFGFFRAKKLLSQPKGNILVIGDQIFTDILGANLAGMKSILVTPVHTKEALWTTFVRNFENPIRKKVMIKNAKEKSQK